MVPDTLYLISYSTLYLILNIWYELGYMISDT